MKKFILSLFSFCLFFSACMEEEKPVTLGVSIIDKKISMTSSKVEGPKLEVYLISENEVSGEVLAKALNAQGQEIGRAKVLLNHSKMMQNCSHSPSTVAWTWIWSVNI